MRELMYDEIKEVNGGNPAVYVGVAAIIISVGLWAYDKYEDAKRAAYEAEMRRLIEENRQTMTMLVPYPCN
jgi:predicted subunit of tRNA(5-methylaminomethyl-2-thiouridylate) methyltransferase